MVGSSNINPDTLQGSFREIGAVVYDVTEARKFENDFKRDWSDKEQSHLMNIESYLSLTGNLILYSLLVLFYIIKHPLILIILVLPSIGPPTIFSITII